MKKKKYMSEEETREYIDRQLHRVDWIRKYVIDEVNSVRSDFKNKNYIVSEGDDDDSGRFIDYLLLAEDGSPIAFIEAKKFSVSENKGRIQARTYQEDIRKQIHKDLPYFLTNGIKWLFMDHNGIEREISGPFSQFDLERKTELYENSVDPTTIDISPIVDRRRSIRIVKKIIKHIQEGHKSALISMATGTGKTRVAMAIIDQLLRAHLVRNVLFVTDRTALTDQAIEKGYKKFFTEKVTDLRKNPKSFPNGLYATTVQTLRSGKPKKFYEKISPGFFELIIFDEAHRSIYDPNREIHKYFDAIRIGLTATPSKADERNTFELFGCDDKVPTVEYTYDDAVEDKVLVPYIAQTINTQVLSLGIEGKKLTKELKRQLEKQEQDPEYMMLPGASFAKVFMDDKTNELVVREFLNRCKKSDDGKPAKTIFFCANTDHAEYLKTIFNKLQPNLGKNVQVIISKYYRYIDELRRFTRNSEPRIALSVGVLDTGVDIPEVCNLVFVKPVFAEIRFTQMFGRGTRNQEACEHLEWLPNRKKDNFLILDFTIGMHSNIKFHRLKQSKERKIGTDAHTKIFLNRLDLLKTKMNKKQKEFIENKIVEQINFLNPESFIVREKLPIIKKVLSRKYDLKTHIDELKNEISPLISLYPAQGSSISSFILKIEKLFRYIVTSDNVKINEIKKDVREKMKNILQKDHLKIIQNKKNDIVKVFDETFWGGLSFEDVDFIIKKLAPLVFYYEPNPKTLIQVDAPDLILNVEKFQYEGKENKKLKIFIIKNNFMKKIKNGKGITSPELMKLEKQLNKIQPEITIENIERIGKIDFIQFLRQLLGLSNDPDPKEIIGREFDRLIIKKNPKYTKPQIQFLQILKSVFVRKKKKFKPQRLYRTPTFH